MGAVQVADLEVTLPEVLIMFAVHDMSHVLCEGIEKEGSCLLGCDKPMGIQFTMIQVAIESTECKLLATARSSDTALC
jgi:hypothetical protein